MRGRGADKERSPYRVGTNGSRDRPRSGGRVMPHPLVDQLRFARSEFQRALEGLTDEDARRRFMPMNCISWNIGHLAWQEQRYIGCALVEAWAAWRTITAAADPWLDTLTT